MLRMIGSFPKRFPACGSDNLGGQDRCFYEESNTLICNACGIIMVLQDSHDEEESDFETSASLVSCPHCRTVDEIQIEGGEEWCAGCGLDPNQTEVPSEELAPLWKEGSGIREAMERGVPKSTASRLYRFLTNLCGPHCSLAQSCPQATGNLAKCFDEEVLESEDQDLLHVGRNEVGRSKKKRSRKERKERIRKEKGRAVLACSSSGWYNKRYYNETEDPQKSTHTGSGPGT